MVRLLVPCLVLITLSGCGGAARMATSALTRGASKAATRSVAATTTRTAIKTTAATSMRPAGTATAAATASKAPTHVPLWKEASKKAGEEVIQRGIERMMMPPRPPAVVVPARGSPPPPAWGGRFMGRDHPLITEVHPNGPAYRAGVRAGDLLYRYDGVSLDGETTAMHVLARAQANASRLGKPQVRLEIVRGGRVYTGVVPGGANLGVRYRTAR